MKYGVALELLPELKISDQQTLHVSREGGLFCGEEGVKVRFHDEKGGRCTRANYTTKREAKEAEQRMGSELNAPVNLLIAGRFYPCRIHETTVESR